MAGVWVKNRRWVAVAFGLALIVVPFGIFGVDDVWSNSLPRRVRSLGVDLSHLTAERGRALLLPAARARANKPLEVRLGKKSVRLVPADLGVRIDAEATLARVRKLGREGNLPRRFGAWLGSFVLPPVDVEPVVRHDAEQLDAELGRIERAAVVPPFGGAFRLEGSRLLPDYPRAGHRLERTEAGRRLLGAVAHGADRIELPVIPAPAPLGREALDRLTEQAKQLTRAAVALLDAESGRTLSLDRTVLARTLRVSAPAAPSTAPEIAVDREALAGALGADLEAFRSEPRPAGFAIDDKDRVHVVPGRPALHVVESALPEAILLAAASPTRVGLLPLARGEEPDLDTVKAMGLGITGLVKSFTTRHPCCRPRVTNIHRIAEILDGLVVEPGKTVSVNEVVGPRTKKNGFVMAPGIEEGEMIDSVGGGVSQFATTLFNALLRGGYDIVERQPHSYWFPRYPMGHEATLSFPKPDLVFRNDTDAGMLIDTKVTPTSVTVRIFGNNGKRRVETQISGRQDMVEPDVELVGDPSVPPDEEKIQRRGTVGWSVIASRTITFADKTTKTESRKVTYSPRAQVVAVHPCRLSKKDDGYTGEDCPAPELDAGELDEESDQSPEGGAPGLDLGKIKAKDPGPGL